MRRMTKDEHYHFVLDWKDQLARWTLLTAIGDPEVVAALHRREISSKKRTRDSVLPTNNILVKQHGLYPFFPADLPQYDGQVRVEAFTKAIYRVWEPIVRRAHETAAEGGDWVFDEIKTLHDCDLAILASGIRIDRAGAELTKIKEKKGKVLKTLDAFESRKSGQDLAAGE